MSKSIEYVCSGNIARSKIAEAFTREFARESGLEIAVSSSGIYTANFEDGNYPDDVASKLKKIALKFPSYQEGMNLWQIYRLLTAHDAYFRDEILGEHTLYVDSASRQTIVKPSMDLIMVFNPDIETAVRDLYAQEKVKPAITTLWNKAGVQERPKGSLGLIHYNENEEPNFDAYRKFCDAIREATKKVVESFKDETS